MDRNAMALSAVRGMRAPLAFAALLFAAASPAAAGSLQFWEASVGLPGVTAWFDPGTGRSADLDFDADSAEGGGMLFGASEIRVEPTAAVAFVSFACELPSCFENQDYVFTPGTAAQGGALIVSDPDFNPKNGIHDLGTLVFDADDAGTIELVGCNYADANAVERTCDPFRLAEVVVSVPLPVGLHAVLLLGLPAVAAKRLGRATAAAVGHFASAPAHRG